MVILTTFFSFSPSPPPPALQHAGQQHHRPLPLRDPSPITHSPPTAIRWPLLTALSPSRSTC